METRETVRLFCGRDVFPGKNKTFNKTKNNRKFTLPNLFKLNYYFKKLRPYFYQETKKGGDNNPVLVDNNTSRA